MIGAWLYAEVTNGARQERQWICLLEECYTEVPVRSTYDRLTY